jgi:hypothetical protein
MLNGLPDSPRRRSPPAEDPKTRLAIHSEAAGVARSKPVAGEDARPEGADSALDGPAVRAALFFRCGRGTKFASETRRKLHFRFLIRRIIEAAGRALSECGHCRQPEDRGV